MAEYALDFSPVTASIEAGSSFDHAFGPPTAGRLTLFLHAAVLNLTGPPPPGSRRTHPSGRDRLGSASNFALAAALQPPERVRAEPPVARPLARPLAPAAAAPSTTTVDAEDEEAVALRRRRPGLSSGLGLEVFDPLRPPLDPPLDPPVDPPTDVSKQIDFEILDHRGEVVATRDQLERLGKHIFFFEVPEPEDPLAPFALELGVVPRKWTLRLHNRLAGGQARLDSVLYFFGQRPILYKEIDLDFLNAKLDEFFNVPQPVRVAFENQQVPLSEIYEQLHQGKVGEGEGKSFEDLTLKQKRKVYLLEDPTFLVNHPITALTEALLDAKSFERSVVDIQLDPAHALLHPELDALRFVLGQGKSFIDEGTAIERMEIRATVHDGSLAFCLAFEAFGGKFDIIDAFEAFRKLGGLSGDIADIFVTSGYHLDRIGGKIFFVLRDVAFQPGYPAPRNLPPEARFEVVTKLAFELSRGTAHELLERFGDGAVAGFLNDVLEKSPRVQSIARDLLGWLLGDRGRRLMPSDQRIALGYTGDPPRPPVVAPPDLGLGLAGQPIDPGNLAKIKHIVVMMMENRSFDHMLGYLSLPPSMGGRGRSDVDGLAAGMTNFDPNAPGRRRGLIRLTGSPLAPLRHDPGHSFAAAKRQRGDRAVELPLLGTVDIGPNDGFVVNFLLRLQSRGLDLSEDRIAEIAAQVMGYYTASELYLYDLLAGEYAICDRWFSSHPGPTWPNRFVSLTGRLAPGPDGRPQIDNPDIAAFDPLEVPTIFDHLLAAGVEWRYFEHDLSMIRLFSKYTFDRERVVPAEDPVRGFYALAAAGRLPPVSYIEPNLTDIPPGNDDHPPSDVRDGQRLAEKVYRALRNSPNWRDSLLIITYDEHGGFFDHLHPVSQPLFDPGDPERGGFVALGLDDTETGPPRPIDHYGMRVPTFVVSPWVPAGHVAKEVYDHTSILKTVIATFLHDKPPDLGSRVALANHLGPLLSNARPRVEPEIAAPLSADPVLSRRARRLRTRPLPRRDADDFRRFLGAFRTRLLETSDPRSAPPPSAVR